MNCELYTKDYRSETTPPPAITYIDYETAYELIDDVRVYACIGHGENFHTFPSSVPTTEPTTPNNAPIAYSQTFNALEQTSYNITLNTTDPDGDTLTHSIVNQPEGTATLSGNVVTYASTSDIATPDIFTFKANDGALDSNIASVTIAITNVNDPPIATGQHTTVVEQTPHQITLSATDPDGDSLTYSIGSPTAGTATLSGNVVTYTSTSDTATHDSFTFKADDGHLDSNTATVTIAITAVNDRPTADSINETATEKVQATYLLAGTDPEDQLLTFSLVSGPSIGNATINSEFGYATYISTDEHATSDVFTFTVSDGELTSIPATVSIAITLINDNPTAYNHTTNVTEGNTVSIFLSGSDPENDPFTVEIVDKPDAGVLSDVTAVNHSVVYYASNDSATGASFTFQAIDAQNATSNVATITINITPINDSPVAVGQQHYVQENTVRTITLSASDPEGFLLTFNITQQPHFGHLTQDTNTAFVHYNASDDNATNDSFTFQANDGSLDSNIATVTIIINNINDPPTAIDDNFAATEGVPLYIVLGGDDVDTPSTELQFIIEPHSLQYGTLNHTEYNDTVIYKTSTNTPGGSESFTFHVYDGNLTSNSATISITILPINDWPVAGGETVPVNEGIPVPILLYGYDSDTLPEQLRFFIDTPPAYGVLTTNTGANDSVTYVTRDDNPPLSDNFTFYIYDGVDRSNIATITLAITPINNAPIAEDYPTNVTAGQQADIYLPGSDPDTNINSTVFSIVRQPTWGNLSNVTNIHMVTYEAPLNTAATSDLFTFQISDTNKTSNIATVNITILPPPPTFAPSTSPTLPTASPTPEPTPRLTLAYTNNRKVPGRVLAALILVPIAVLACTAAMGHVSSTAGPETEKDPLFQP